mmetsp:Transcript_38904/g.61519  ORF Transcript_38904/g.61519 Transcript_38904/m.61519 type:complete len:84 (+) Transcript_38904:1635-1886(+)
MPSSCHMLLPSHARPQRQKIVSEMPCFQVLESTTTLSVRSVAPSAGSVAQVSCESSAKAELCRGTLRAGSTWRFFCSKEQFYF